MRHKTLVCLFVCFESPIWNHLFINFHGNNHRFKCMSISFPSFSWNNTLIMIKLACILYFNLWQFNESVWYLFYPKQNTQNGFGSYSLSPSLYNKIIVFEYWIVELYFSTGMRFVASCGILRTTCFLIYARTFLL